MLNLDEMKRQAYILFDFLKQEYQDTEVFIYDCLDAIAKINGYENWDQAVKIMEE